MNDQHPLPAPGWYADPAAPETALRYWDGTTWTEHVHPLEAAGSAAEEAERPVSTPTAETEQAAIQPTPTAPDTAVPSAGPGATAAAEADRAAAEPAGGSADAPAPQAVPPVQTVPEQRPNPYAPDTAQTASAARQQNPYGSAPQPPAPPIPPWAQGPGNPYQSPQPAQYGDPAAAASSRTGLWIGLGIGGGVLLLLVIGVIIAVVAFFASIGNSMREYEPAPLPSYDLDAPGGDAPDIDGEIYGMGDPFVIPDLAGTGEGWEVTVVDFSAEAAEAASAAPGNKAFAVLVEVTNLGGVALDPYFAMMPTFVGDDGLEYTDLGMIEPDLFDVDEVEPGATARFTATFEVPEDLEDAGTLVLYDGYMDEYFAVAVG